MQYRHTQFDESVNVTPTNPVKEFATYLFAIFALIGVVYYVSIFAVELLIPYVNKDTEQWLWNKIFKDNYFTEDTKRTPKLVEAEKYLQQLMDRIPKDGVPNHEYKIILMDDPRANAMALPSGKIIVYSGLLKNVKSENGIVFVLGHELGHYAHHDHLRGMGRALIAGIILAPILGDANVGGMFSSIGYGFDMHFSREQESAADDFGLKAVEAVYGHAGGVNEFFEYVDQNRKEPMVLKYMSTHPVSTDRIKHLNMLIHEQHIKTEQVTPKKVSYP